jgi:hypothetical protein
MELPLWRLDVPLIPFVDKSESPITLNYYYLSESGAKEPVQFTLKGEEVWLDHERLKAKKIREI